MTARTPTTTDVFQFLLLTDLHLPPPGELVHGRDTAVRLEAVLADIAARHGPGGTMPPVAFAALTGDLVRNGEPAAYARLKTLLTGLPCPAHLMLGNHDDRVAFRAAFADAPVDPSGFVQQALPTPAGLCLMLDTLDAGKDAGRLCERRLAWLAARLAESADAPVLLFMHHPPMPIGIAGMDAIALQDPEALWAVLAPHRARIRHLFHGHTHRPIAGSWRGIPLSSLRGTAFDVALDLAPPPRRVAVEPALAPNYGLVWVRGEDIVVHTRALPPNP